MTPIQGKRNRRKQSLEENRLSPVDAENANAILKRHFETAFQPLAGLKRIVSPCLDDPKEESQHEEDSDWDGISDSEAEVIQHNTSQFKDQTIPTGDLKTFMSFKPPTSHASLTNSQQPKILRQAEDDETDKDNIKKDLALQRLLKESHLLEQHSPIDHFGKTRHKALDLRLQDMGSKTSVFAQQKMPYAQRKGISAKASEREGNRRREARDNGIVLEKERRVVKRADIRRERGIGAPSVGRFQGGTYKQDKVAQEITSQEKINDRLDSADDE
ncbi:uncharacterized protein KY384_003818 [Bacidia gigantensis]|uniref:uncharacterized protein n=1 Tax=Bacidia gigantensis TaxID=2732470 RepID=UPI001D046CCE|nr:uncharacterized protein KY384_003818 [Bacidia gigantensis]KAG8532178.1 hypothetical protein KY384_003818 [Bacidia gigantensis]